MAIAAAAHRHNGGLPDFSIIALENTQLGKGASLVHVSYVAIMDSRAQWQQWVHQTRQRRGTFMKLHTLSLAFLITVNGLVFGTVPAAADQCDSRIARLQADGAKLPNSAQHHNDVLNRLQKKMQEWDKQKAHYDRLRAEDRLAEADAQAARLDTLWETYGSIDDERVQSISNAIEIRERFCRDMSEAKRLGCTIDVTNCERFSRLNEFYEQQGPDYREWAEQFKTSWRGPEDRDFFHAGNDCPDASVEQAVVELGYGRAFVVRGMRTLPVEERTEVFPGDIVAVEDNSMVTVRSRFGAMRIAEKTKFEIPDPKEDLPPHKIRVWGPLLGTS